MSLKFKKKLKENEELITLSKEKYEKFVKLTSKITSLEDRDASNVSLVDKVKFRNLHE